MHKERTALFAVLRFVIIHPVAKIILGEIFRFPESLVRVEAFAVAVVIKSIVILCKLLRTDDFYLVADAAHRKQGNHDKDNRSGAAGIFLFRFWFFRFLRFRWFFFPNAAL